MTVSVRKLPNAGVWAVNVDGARAGRLHKVAAPGRRGGWVMRWAIVGREGLFGSRGAAVAALLGD